MQATKSAGGCDSPQDDIPEHSAADDLIRALFKMIRLSGRLGEGDGERIPILQSIMLHELNGNAGIRLTDLATSAHLEISVASRQINLLEADGWVARTRDPADGRAWLFELTPAGHERYDLIRKRLRAGVARVLDEFDDTQLTTATAVINTINASAQAASRRHRTKTPEANN